jgi:F-type H+-transporting ATPase subunit b
MSESATPAADQTAVDQAAAEALAADMAGAMKADMLGTEVAPTMGNPLQGAPSVASEGQAGTLVPADDHSTAVKKTFLGFDTTGWVAIGMLVLIGIMLWKRVPAMITAALDAKIAGIRKQLDEAQTLRAEAEALRQSFEARKAEAEREAAAIVAHAREEAASLIATTRQQTDEMITRRTRMAEERIAAAERAAELEVRGATASLATEAARTVLAQRLAAGQPDRLVDQAIADLDRKLH